MNKHVRFGALVAMTCLSFATSYPVDFSGDKTLSKITDRIETALESTKTATEINDLKTKATAQVAALKLKVDANEKRYLNVGTSQASKQALAEIEAYEAALAKADEALLKLKQKEEQKAAAANAKAKADADADAKAKATAEKVKKANDALDALITAGKCPKKPANVTSIETYLNWYINENDGDIQVDVIKQLVEAARIVNSNFAQDVKLDELDNKVQAFKEALYPVFNPTNPNDNKEARQTATEKANALPKLFDGVKAQVKEVNEALAAEEAKENGTEVVISDQKK